MQIKFNLALLRTENGLLRTQTSVCCTQKVTVKGCHRYSILAVAVHRYLHEVQWSLFAIAGEWC